jgi:hypothetical protein
LAPGKSTGPQSNTSDSEKMLGSFGYWIGAAAGFVAFSWEMQSKARRSNAASSISGRQSAAYGPAPSRCLGTTGNEEGRSRKRDARHFRVALPNQILPAECRIKGNIGANGRIYHMPGSRDYDKVVINPAKGERYFCSEEEARACGWREPGASH